MSGQVVDEHGNALAHCFQIGEDPRATRPQQIEPNPAPVPRAPVVVAPSKPHAASEAVSTRALLKQLKDRLRVVEREIKLRQRLESERSQLMRLISAAKLERDNVRRLRSAG
jgi:hypothetical protein